MAVAVAVEGIQIALEVFVVVVECRIGVAVETEQGAAGLLPEA